MSILVRHRTASGRLDEAWELRDGRVHVSMKSGAVVVHFSVAVCSDDRPFRGAHPIRRVDADTWRIVPLLVVRRADVLSMVSCAIGEILSVGEQLLLTSAPASANAELEAL